MPPTPGNLIGQSPNGIVSVQIGAGLALSAGTLSVSGGGTGGTPTIVGGGIVSVSSRSNSFTISATGGGASGNFAYQSAVGNTTGATSSQTRLLTLESYRFAGGVSGGFSAGSLVISGVTTAASGTLQNRFALGNTTSATSSFAGTLSILSVSGAGLASAGFDTNGVLVISATSGTVAASATSMNLTATGNTTGSSSATTRVLTAETISGAGGVSVGFSGNTILISGATTAAQTAPTLSIYAVGNTTTSVSSGVIAAGSLSFDGAGAVSVGISGSSVVISAPAAVASASTMNVTALGNTTGSSSATTRLITAESISFTGGVSGGWSGNTLVISGATAVASATSMNMTALGNTTGSSSATTKVLTEMSISGMGNISAGFSGGTIVISGTVPADSATSMGLSAVGNTAGSTSSMTNALTAETLVGSGAVRVGFSGGSIVISGDTGTALGVRTLSYWEPRSAQNVAALRTVSLGTVYLIPVELPVAVSINQMRFFASRTFINPGGSLGLTSGAGTANATASAFWNLTEQIYRYTNSDATTFSTIDSASLINGITWSWSLSRNNTSFSISESLLLAYGGGAFHTDTVSTTVSTVGSSITVSNEFSAGGTAPYVSNMFHGVPWATSFPPGFHVFGHLFPATASGTAVGATWCAVTAGTWSISILTMQGITGPGVAVSGPGDVAAVPRPSPYGGGILSSIAGSTAPATWATTLAKTLDAQYNIQWMEMGVF